jgi:hypothetical protein
MSDAMSRERALKQVLLLDWDPIGVAEFPEAQDEYDSYLPSVVALLSSGGNQQQLADHLYWIATVQMGLGGSHQHAQKIAAQLIRVWVGTEA